MGTGAKSEQTGCRHQEAMNHKEQVMYISSSALQAMHQEIVDDCLRRSALRRAHRERYPKTTRRAGAWIPRVALTALVRSVIDRTATRNGSAPAINVESTQ
jgi:hypothetical protein